MLERDLHRISSQNFTRPNGAKHERGFGRCCLRHRRVYPRRVGSLRAGVRRQSDARHRSDFRCYLPLVLDCQAATGSRDRGDLAGLSLRRSLGVLSNSTRTCPRLEWTGAPTARPSLGLASTPRRSTRRSQRQDGWRGSCSSMTRWSAPRTPSTPIA